MADKFKQGVSVVTSFVEGETPSPAKLNSITSQLRYAAGELEKAIGDAHDYSHPYSATTNETLSAPYGRQVTTGAALGSSRFLNIANIARLIGPAGNLNPRVFVQGAGPHTVTESVASGKHEIRTRWPIDDITTMVFSDASVFATRQANPSDVVATGHYYVDSSGYVTTYDVTAGGTVQYEVDPASFGGGSNAPHATFNVIPDQAQLDNGGSGCTVSGTADAQGRYAITLPTATHIHSDVSSTTQTLDAADILNGQQLTLPEVITDNYTTGDAIPEGFVYLKNYTTGQVFEAGTYYYVSATQLSIGGSLDSTSLETGVSDGNAFQIFTVGYDITTAIADVQYKLRHAHNRARGGSWLNVESVRGHLDVATSKGFYVPSEIEGNAFPQYLHRDGYDLSDDGLNDRNAMRGALVLGVNGATTGSYVSGSGESYGIYFGNTSGAGRAYIRRDSNEDLEIYSNNEIQITAEGAGTSNIDTNGALVISTSNGGDINLSAGEDNLVSNNSVTDIRPVQGDTLDGLVNVGHRVAIGLTPGAAANTGLNSTVPLGAIAAEGMAIGPFRSSSVSASSEELPVWEIETNGLGPGAYAFSTDDSATYTPAPAGSRQGFVVPRIHHLYFSFKDVTFRAKQDNGIPNTSAADVSYYASEPIVLPDYLFHDYESNKGVHAILACNVMVRGGNDLETWHGGGTIGLEGPSVAFRLYRLNDGTPDENRIEIYFRSTTTTTKDYAGADIEPVVVTSDSEKDMDVKIFLTVASPAGGDDANEAVSRLKVV